MFRQSHVSAISNWTSAGLFVAALFVSATWPAQAQVSASLSASTTFRPNTPLEVQSGKTALVGHYAGNMLRLTIGLQPPHVAEERQFLEDLQNPHKGSFHQFLSAEEWTERFDPSVDDEQAVVNWATLNGLTVTKRYSNRLLVDVEAPVAVIEKALNVTINSYQLGTTTGYSNDRDPQIPSNLTSIIHSIGGLQNLHVAHPMNNNLKEPVFPDYVPGPVMSEGPSAHGNGDRSKLALKTAAKNTKSSGLSPNYTTGPPYDPQDMYSVAAYSVQALYNLGHCCNPTDNAGGTPPQTTIAIATAGTQSSSDLDGWAGGSGAYPYLAYHWSQVYIDGTPSCCDGEGTLDFDWTTAMSNSFGSYLNTSLIILYDGVNADFGTFNDVYNTVLTQNVTRNFTTSWGCEEIGCYPTGDMDTADGIFASMVGQGWTLTAASGDQGASAGCGDATAVQFPASDPNILGAGGTTHYMYQVGDNAAPSFDGFYAWSGGPDGCGSNDGGSTGGYSAWWSTPSYQTVLGLGSRGVPDIALNADWYNTPMYMFYGGVLEGNGGTSIVAPTTAGFFAQENAYLLALGDICGGSSCAPMGAINSRLYDTGYYGDVPHYPFYDITAGCNDNDVTTYYDLTYYCAGTGWDAVTGWGEYNFLQMAWALNWSIIPGVNYPQANFYDSPTTNQWYNTDQIVYWDITNTAGQDGSAGFSQQWDGDPGNPTTESTPGIPYYSCYGSACNPPNSFYDGPMYANSASGCLDFTGACANSTGGAQGLHTVNVRTFGNEGESDLFTYGPIGYDTVAPVTTDTLSGTVASGTTYKSAVTVTLNASDPGSTSTPPTGSGVAHTYYQINGEGWQTYSAPFTVGYTGSYVVYYYSIDNAGNAGSILSASFKINPVLSMSPASLSFGNEVLGKTSAGQTVTITNVSSASVNISSITPSGDFAISLNTCGSSLGSKKTCTVTVTYTPSVIGAILGDVTMAYSGLGSPNRVSLFGTGVVPLTVSPASLSFGTVTVGSTSGAQTLTLKNDNPSTALTISFGSSGDYSAVAGGGTPCGATLAAAASCTLNVTFKPHQNGSIGGAVSVKDGVTLGPVLVALSGTGSGGVAVPLTFTPASLSFANTVVSATTTKTVTVKNVSAESVKISAITDSGDYASSGCVTTLASGASCTLTVTFTPSTTGKLQGAITVKNNTAVTPEILDASGSGTLPLTLSPGTVGFGTWTVGTTSGASTITLTNHRATAATISLAASGDFTASAGGGTPCGASLAAGASCTFVVSFSPTTAGSVSGVATVTYSGRYSPQEVKLSGTGQ